VKTKTHYLFFCIILFNGYFLVAQESNPVIDSLLNVIKTSSSHKGETTSAVTDTSQINALNLLSNQYISTGAHERALRYAENAMKLAEEINYAIGVSRAYINIGIIYDIQNDFGKALYNFQQALKISTAAGDKNGMLKSYNNIGNIYNNMGNYDEAFGYYLKSLKISEEISNKVGTANAYSNIGNIYYYLGKLDKTLENYYKSLEIYEELKDKGGQTACYSNIGVVYSIQGDYGKALPSYLKSLKISEEMNDRQGMATAYSNIGGIYDLRGNYEEALKNYLKSLKLNEELHDKTGITIDYLNIANENIKRSNFPEADRYLKKSLSLAKETGAKDRIKEVYFSSAELYEKKGDYKQAFEYHKLYSDIKDSLLNEESSKQITEMNTKYESEKKEKDIQLLTKDKELQMAEIGRQKLIRNGFVGGLAIALLLAFVLFNRFQVTRKQKGIIEYQNSQIVESINYSKRIQDALLPSIESMQQAIPSLFVFYEPKNIVSGDFYFFKEFENYILLACVDCTGHGVPGGFMSTLGSLLLDKIANDENLKPSEILIKLSDEIVRVLHQQDGGEIQDGMDLSVCLIDRNNRQIEFSGARNGIIVVSDNEAKRYKASPLPVGGNYMKKGVPIARNFQTQNISLNANDWVYMYTDGFIEQIGADENIPMNYEQFERQLIGLSKQQTIELKMELLKVAFNKWRGKNEPTDDVLIIGFKII
jgi:tetratricopeptide (TPR) repeat protein/serine phosphatase RsbU (regulator of sigma subunit)